MKILIAPDKFKGSLSAMEVAQAIANGIHRFDANMDYTLHPLADGGDGSVEILAQHLGWKKVSLTVSDPLGRKMEAKYYRTAQAAYIELAAASGLVLLQNQERNPLQTTTYGTGEMIVDAIKQGAKKIYLFLGGSATNDAGIGIASALGFRFLDQSGQTLAPIGENLIHIHAIDTTSITLPLEGVDCYCLCDVQNPMLGLQGASHVYAPQKGATSEIVEQLEFGMQHYASIVQAQLKKDIRTIVGGGAAGGIAAGLFGLLNAQIQSGIDTILDLSGFEAKAKNADIIISGEGKLDHQTLEGKVISGVAHVTQRLAKPLVLFVGQSTIDEKTRQDLGIEAVHAVMNHAKNLEDAIANAAAILEQLGYEFVKNSSFA